MQTRLRECMMDPIETHGGKPLELLQGSANPHASNATPAEKATLFRRVTIPFRSIGVRGYFSDTEEIS
jgi:hypothetical protein